ncbi:MAG: hydrogenase iron-sulfur subunit [Anaerolineales bacterium]|jgi:coenzyme F420-reducing hydrogenase delta subunit
MATTAQPNILILASLSGGYAGADSVGQAHRDYPANTYILPVRSPAMFPPKFYIEAFEKGIDAILVMYSGTDCPYEGAAERTALLLNDVYQIMKDRGVDSRRLKLVAICTVCTDAFMREIRRMNEVLDEIGPVANEMSRQAVH